MRKRILNEGLSKTKIAIHWGGNILFVPNMKEAKVVVRTIMSYIPPNQLLHVSAVSPFGNGALLTKLRVRRGRGMVLLRQRNKEYNWVFCDWVR